MRRSERVSKRLKGVEDAERESIAERLKSLKRKLIAENKASESDCLEEGTIKMSTLPVDQPKQFYSHMTNIHGLPFQLSCHQHVSDGYVYAMELLGPEAAIWNIYSAKVACTMRLESSCKHRDTFREDFCGVIGTRGQGLRPHRSFRAFWEIEDPCYGFNQDGIACFVAQIKVIWCRKEAIEDIVAPSLLLQSHVIVCVEDRAFHLVKQHLMYFSEYFKVIFNSKFAEQNKKVITLQEFSANQFELMLGILPPQTTKVTSVNVRTLLCLADFFLVDLVRRACTEYLMTSRAFSRIQKLLLSEEFRLPDLKNNVIADMWFPHDFKSVIDSEDFSKLSEPLQALIMERHLEFSFR